MGASLRDRYAAALAVVVCGLLPWLVVRDTTGSITLVMGWGLVNTDPWHVVTLYEYLGHTPGFSTLPIDLQAWPIGFLFYLCAIASAISGVAFDREDPRLTGGLLLLTVVSGLWVWSRFLGLGAFGVVPVAPIAIGVVVWWFYWPRLRSGLPASDPGR